MNLFRRELRANLRSLLSWGAGIFVFLAASMMKYSALAADPSAFNIMDSLPLGLQAVFGVGQLDFMKASGFYGMLYPYLLLMASIHASMLGAVILSKEERDRTSEFLYVKPVTRTNVVTAKLLAALVMVAVLNLMIWASSLSFLNRFGNGEDVNGIVSRLMVGLFLVQLVFLSLGIASAAVLKRPKTAAGIAAGAMLAAYIVSVAIDVNTKLDWLKAFTPFQYFDAKLIIGQGENLNLWYAALSLALTAAFCTLAYVSFKKRDIKV